MTGARLGEDPDEPLDRLGQGAAALVLAAPKSPATWQASRPTAPSPTTITVLPGRMPARATAW